MSPLVPFISEPHCTYLYKYIPPTIYKIPLPVTDPRTNSDTSRSDSVPSDSIRLWVLWSTSGGEDFKCRRTTKTLNKIR